MSGNAEHWIDDAVCGIGLHVGKKLSGLVELKINRVVQISSLGFGKSASPSLPLDFRQGLEGKFLGRLWVAQAVIGKAAGNKTNPGSPIPSRSERDDFLFYRGCG